MCKKNAKMLSIYGQPNENVTEECLFLLNTNKEAKGIKVSGGIVDNRVLEAIAKKKNIETILFPYGSEITDNGIKALSHKKGIIYTLDIAGSKITNEAMKYIKKMNISSLILKNTAIGDDALKKLIDTKITHLNIKHCPSVTDKGVKHISRSKHLENIYLSKNNGITDKGIGFLLKMKTIKKVYMSLNEDGRDFVMWDKRDGKIIEIGGESQKYKK